MPVNKEEEIMKFERGDIVKAVNPSYEQDTVGIVIEVREEVIEVKFFESWGHTTYFPKDLIILEKGSKLKDFYMNKTARMI